MRPFVERARSGPHWWFHVLNAIPDAYIQMPDAVADLFDEAACAG
jgi:hypothetical protein